MSMVGTVRWGTALELERFIMNGGDVNERPYSWTPLIYAVDTECIDKVRLLLKHGADPNLTSNGGRTPLIYACMNEKSMMDIVHLLLDEDADIDIVDNDGWTALSYASYAGHIEIVSLLVERGADMNHMTNTGRTPLMYAAERSHEPVVRYLIEMGADIKDNDDHTALDYCSDTSIRDILS